MRVKPGGRGRATPGPGGPTFGAALARAGEVAGAAPRRRPGPALPELREAARAIPAAIWAGRLGDGAAVELAFGPGLTLVLRAAPCGVELVVDAGPGLERIARGDLPALVDALRERGVAVARAEVRGCSHGGGHRARVVDARPPLR